MKVAIVGSNGFVGQYLTKCLIEGGGLEIFLFGKSTTNKNYELLKNYKPLILDNTTNDFKNIDLVYYLASETIPASSWNNPTIEIQKNLLPFVKFCENLETTSVKKIVYLSSAGTIYGPSEKKLSENSNKIPFSPYGITKLCIENFLNYFKIKSNINYDIYRISNIYGIGQDTSKGLGLINTFLEKIIKGENLTVFGDGTSVRNYIYVNDVAIILANCIRKDLTTSNIFNLSSNDTLSITSVIQKIKLALDVEFRVDYLQSRKSDNSAIDLDNSSLMNYFPTAKFTPLEIGIREIYNHIKNNG